MRHLFLLTVLAFPLSTRACPMEDAAATTAAASKAAPGIETAQAPAGVVDVTIPLRPASRGPASVSAPASAQPEAPEN